MTRRTYLEKLEMGEYPLLQSGLGEWCGIGEITAIPTTSVPLANLELNRIYCNEWQLENHYQRLTREGKTFIPGNGSLYVMGERVKYLDIALCEQWPNEDNIFIPMLPGEIARTELRRAFGTPKMKITKDEFPLLDVPPPNYYDGEERDGLLYYCDLKSAYHQIYENLALDVVWPRAMGELLLRGVGQRLRANKSARNAVIGISRTYKMDVFKDGDIRENPFSNPYFNPSLWRTVQSVLHEVAEVAINEGCHYVATDGYIFSDPVKFFTFTGYLGRASFNYESFKGKGYITGWSSYKVGRKETKFKRHNTGTLDSILKGERSVEWLKKIRRINQGQ